MLWIGGNVVDVLIFKSLLRMIEGAEWILCEVGDGMFTPEPERFANDIVLSDVTPKP